MNHEKGKKVRTWFMEVVEIHKKDDNASSDVGEIFSIDGVRALKQWVLQDGEIWSWTLQNHTRTETPSNDCLLTILMIGGSFVNTDPRMIGLLNILLAICTFQLDWQWENALPAYWLATAQTITRYDLIIYRIIIINEFKIIRGNIDERSDDSLAASPPIEINPMNLYFISGTQIIYID